MPHHFKLGASSLKPDIFSSTHNAEHDRIGSNMRGELGEAIVKLMFIQNGWRVSDARANYPYDFVIERHDQTRRVQVKTVRRSNVANFKASDDFDTAAIVMGDGSIYVIPRNVMSFKSAGRDKARLKFHITRYMREAYRVGEYTPIKMG